jgi:hypothetical protein
MPKSEYRLSVVVSELGKEDVAEANMERFVEAFDALYPEAGAVMAANYRLEALDATFSVEADDAKTATDLGLDMFCEAATKTAIPPTEIVDIRTTLVAAADHEQTTAEFALSR